MSVHRRNNVKLLGSGERAMVFAHGFGCDQNMWRFVWPAFAEKYRIVLFDHVGCGGSDLAAYDADEIRSLDGYARRRHRDLPRTGHHPWRLRRPFRQRHDRRHCSLKAPDIFDELVMIGPSPRYINDEDYTGGFSERKSTSSSTFLTPITWAGRRPWPPSSWAIPTGRNWARS